LKIISLGNDITQEKLEEIIQQRPRVEKIAKGCKAENIHN
jgi:hypothetical protein